jgi:hypothetical protein
MWERSAAMVGILAGLLVLAGSATAQNTDTDKWEIGAWSGETTHARGQFFACSAMFFDTRQDNSFTVRHYQRSYGDRSASPLYIYFTDDDSDDKGFAWLQGGSVTMSVGASFRASLKIVQALVHSFEFEAPTAALDAFAAGGPWSLQLPTGKPYTMKLPPAAEAMANFRKCLAANQGR